MPKQLKNIYVASIIFIILFIIGVVGYMYIESYSLLEAVFMTIITISTVGYGEVHKLSHFGMIFTVVFIITSFGLFGYLATYVTRMFVNGDYRKYLKEIYVNKKIKKIKKHIIVCGFGRNGRQATIELLKQKEYVIFIEKSEEVVEEDINVKLMKNKRIIHLHGDASHEESLKKAKLKKAKALITTLPNDAENLLIVLTAREINQNVTIISRASDEHTYSKLMRAGANNVIMPDIVGGTRMAKLVTQPDIIEFLEMIMLREGVDVNLEEISCSTLASCFVNSSISSLEIKRRTGANLIGLKLGNGKYLFNPRPGIKLKKEDKLFVLGKPHQIKRLTEVLTTGTFFNRQ